MPVDFADFEVACGQRLETVIRKLFNQTVGDFTLLQRKVVDVFDFGAEHDLAVSRSLPMPLKPKARGMSLDSARELVLCVSDKFAGTLAVNDLLPAMSLTLPSNPKARHISSNSLSRSFICWPTIFP